MNENILKLFERTGKGEFPLEKEIGLAQGSIKNWKLGKSKPSADALYKIAVYFDVSIDYLFARPSYPEIKMSDFEHDMSAWYNEKLQMILSPLVDMSNFLLDAKKTAINDSGIRAIESMLESALYPLVKVIATTAGAKNWSVDDHETIIKNGYSGYEELMTKYGITQQDLNSLFCRDSQKKQK